MRFSRLAGSSVVLLASIISLATPSRLAAQTALDYYNACNKFDIDAGNIDDGIASCSMAIQSGQLTTAGLAFALEKRAWLYGFRKRYAAAVADLTRSIQLQPSASNYSLRANMYRKQSEWNSALTDYREALARKPGDADVLNDMAFLYYEGLHHIDPAITLWEMIAGPQRDHIYLHAIKDRAERSEQGGHHADAIEDYTIAMLGEDASGDPSDQWAARQIQFARAKEYSLLRRYDDAIADLDNCLASDPRWTDAYLERGLAHFLKKSYAPAISDFSRVLLAQPANAIALRRRGESHLRQAEYARAEDDFSRALTAAPRDPVLLRDRALARSALDNFQGIVSDIATAIEVVGAATAEAAASMPTMSTLTADLGYAYRRLGRLDEAEAMLVRSNGLDNSRSLVHGQLGLVYLAQGQAQKALDALSMAIKLDPAQTGTLYARGLAKRALNDIAGGDADIAAAERRSPGIGNLLASQGVVIKK